MTEFYDDSFHLTKFFQQRAGTDELYSAKSSSYCSLTVENFANDRK